MKIKICGMREPGNIRDVAELAPDFMGFIFYDRSPRYVGADFVMPDLPPELQKTGVFVKTPAERVRQLAGQHGLDYVQLHSDESPAYCTGLKAAGLKILKAFLVDTAFDFEQLKAFEGKADYFLFDTKGDGYGGHGKTFDWEILNKYTLDTPFFIAGGISNDTIGKLLQYHHPMFKGIDVNSRYEISPGVKDVGALREMFFKLKVNS